MHCALENGANLYVNERHTFALGLLKKEPNRDFFYFARRVRELLYYSDVIHSFDWKSAIEHDGGV